MVYEFLIWICFWHTVLEETALWRPSLDCELVLLNSSLLHAPLSVVLSPLSGEVPPSGAARHLVGHQIELKVRERGQHNGEWRNTQRRGRMARMVMYLLQEQQIIVLISSLASLRLWLKLSISSKKGALSPLSLERVWPLLFSHCLCLKLQSEVEILESVLFTLFFSQIQCNCECASYDRLLIYSVLIAIWSLHTKLSGLGECRLLPFCPVFINSVCYRFPGYCV